MIENMIAFIVISSLLYASDKKRAIGWLVFCYYAFYIIIEIDYFGVTIGNLFTTYDDFLKWYLVCTAISSLVFVSCVIIYLRSRSKVALFYCCWTILDMFISGLSAVFQAYETNALLYWYNILQNFNLTVDILVVILGTDTKIKGTQHVRNIAYCVYSYLDHHINLSIKNSGRYK